MAATKSITIYEPNSREKLGFIESCLTIFKNIVSYREMIFVLFKRDFFASYRKSYLGMTWLFVSPVMAALSWIFINAAGILNPGDVGMPYPAYVLLSTTIWTLYMGFYTAGQGTLSAGAGIINQVKYPHEVLLVKQLAQHVANSLIAIGVNLVVLACMGVIPSWKSIFLPMVALPLLFLGAGIGLVTSIFTVVAPELTRIADIAMGLMIWVTPVIYSPKFQNVYLQMILKWNPLTYLISAPRDLIVKGHIEEFPQYCCAVLFSFVVFFISWRIFHVTEDKVIERML